MSHRRAASALAAWLLSAATAAGSWFGVGTALAQPRDTSTTVFVVRHAEQVRPWPDKNPPLSPVGLKRAEALAHVLRDAGVTAIYSTDLKRSHDTAAPLAAILRDSIRVWDGKDIGGMADRILKVHVGGKVVVIGHSDSVPLLVGQLSGEYVDQVPAHEYDLLYVVVIRRDGSTKLLKLRYGDPTPAPP